jgi:hypothetical protein
MKTFICKIKFGLQETTETKTFRFKTKEELNAFYLGLDAAIGYMEYEEIEEETKNPITIQVENLLDEHYNETFK